MTHCPAITMQHTSTPILQSPFGDFALERYPKPDRRKQKQEPLRAWDAADEYLLQQAHEAAPQPGAHITLVNDGFGALATAFNGFNTSAISDSFIAQQACLQNLQDNQCDEHKVRLLNSLQSPEQTIDLLLIKVPKTLAMLEDQLYRLRPHINAQTTIIAGGMVKNIHNSTLALFEKILGPTHTSLAKKKARLIYCQPQPDQWQGTSPYPSEYPLENTTFTLSSHANVFSRASLDIGTRLLLEHVAKAQGTPEAQTPQTIVDLGCGNGVIGLYCASQYPQAKVIFSDESFMAVASAQQNFEQAFGSARAAEYQVNNCLDDMAADSVDWVLNNPPFHQQSAIATHIAAQMFSDARRVLKAGGKLWVIANRHLGYHVNLKRIFGNCETLTSNKKFVLLCATKR